MGIYRFFLALLVAVSHAGIKIFDFNPGVVAVISFFLLSGYVMTQLIRKYYLQPALVGRFYLDRAARLFPQYLFYFALASLFLYVSGMPTIFTYQLDVAKWLLNIPILPLGFYQWILDGATVLPQAWSLGLEMCFYLTIPWLLLYCSQKQLLMLALASLAIFTLAYAGVINTDAFGYRLLPGTLFMFLAGASYAATTGERRAACFRYGVGTVTIALFLFACWQPRYYAMPYNKEVLVGLLLGLMAVGYLRHLPFSPLDEFFGNLSYGVFLNHFIIIWWLRHYFDIKDYAVFDVIMLLALATLLATLSFYLIERPAIRWRHLLRQRTALQPPVSEPSMPVAS